MMSPYILRHATTTATAEQLDLFLRDYFYVCQKELPTEEQSTLMSFAFVWDFENNTGFPLFIRRGHSFCDITRDPSAPVGKKLFNNANFLTNAEDRRYLLRCERYLTPSYMYDTDETLTVSILRSVNGWFRQIDLTQNNDCAAIQIETNGRYGIIDPCGKMLVPPLYNNIVPFSLRMREISLFVCYKGDTFTNTVDVYDTNGNKIYEDIGGLYPHTEQVKHDFSPGGSAPSARFIEKLRVVQYTQPPIGVTQPPYKEYIRDVNNLRLLPCADKDGGPTRIKRFSGEVHFARNIEDVDLRDIHDVLLPLAKRMGAHYGNTAGEMMLCIPHWNFFRIGHQPFEGVTQELSLDLIREIPSLCRSFLADINIHTAGELADADFSDLEIESKELEAQLFLAQLKMQYTLAHPEEQSTGE